MIEQSARDDSTELPGSPRSRHFELFDSMRAVAVLGVLVIHVGAASGANLFAWYGVATSQGRLGVRIFFVISAFLLYRPYAMAQLHDAPGPDLATYAKRRALRILPAYWVALTLLSIWPGLPAVWTDQWWIYFGMLQAYFYSTIHSGLAVAWSLTIEVAFYVALPLLALCLGRLGRGASPKSRLRRQLWALAALGLASETFRIAVFSMERRELNFTLPSMFLPFAVGMGLAVASAWLGCDERRWHWTRLVVEHPGACWSAAIGIFVACCFTPIFARAGAAQHTVWTWGLEQFVYVLISLLLILPAVFGEEAGGWPRRILANHWVGFVGAVSYGVFLWHHPVLDWMTKAGWGGAIPGFPVLSLFVPCLLFSVLLGWASHRWIERPAMRLRGEPPKRVT